MSRPGNCWLCSVDPSEWWMYVDYRVWCERCHKLALSFFAAVVNTHAAPVIIGVLSETDPHLANEIARALDAARRRREQHQEARRAKGYVVE